MLHSSSWNHLTVWKQMSFGLFQMLLTNYSQIIIYIYIYIYKEDLTLNNPQEFICHKTPTNQPSLCSGVTVYYKPHQQDIFHLWPIKDVSPHIWHLLKTLFIQMLIYIYIYIYIYICMYIFICVYVCIYIYIYIYIYMCVCIYVCIYIYIYMCVCVCVCVYIYVCVCVCVYIYIYIYSNEGFHLFLVEQ